MIRFIQLFDCHRANAGICLKRQNGKWSAEHTDLLLKSELFR